MSEQEFREEQFLLACQHGGSGIHIVKRMLARGINLETRDAIGNTGLHLAAQNGRLQIVKMLIAAGADVNARDIYNSTPLMKAVSSQRLKVVKELLQPSDGSYGANPDITDLSPPLFIAIRNGDVDIVKELIYHGANPYITDVHGRNIVYPAVRRALSGILESVLDLGVSPFVEDNFMVSPLDIAKKLNNSHIIENYTPSLSSLCIRSIITYNINISALPDMMKPELLRNP